ncbi:DUF1542 domain-containing protein, partial [Lactobacillus bombicola]|uniref:DUF1542 domain-containing protein n=1 Tax=Lactobacillus bombicola TaxID=1505723 RepID=UPI000EEE4695
MNRFELIEEIKNTNYKMHKSKKGWVVSYSLLTFMLGGVFYGTTNVQEVKAADIESQTSQSGGSKAALEEASAKALSDAVEDATNTLETKAAEIKQKINADQSMTANEKEAQLNSIDNLFNKAKAEVTVATDLDSIKNIVDDTVLKIDASYKIDNTKNSIVTNDQNKDIDTKKVSKNSTGNKKNLKTYSGLNSFLDSKPSVKKSKTVSSKPNKINGADKNIADSNSIPNDAKSTINNTKSSTGKSIELVQAPSNSSENIPKSDVATKVTASDVPTDKVSDKKDLSEYTAQAEATPRIETAADTDASKDVTVSSDADAGRDDFVNGIGKTASKAPTAVNIAVPDQVTNPDKYKQKVANVADIQGLANAWADATVTYINITNDIAYTGGIIGNRNPGASVVINGNGHKIDLGSQTLSYLNVPYNNLTTLTLTNAKFLQGFTQNDVNQYSLVFCADGSGLNINFDNITLSSSEFNGLNPIHATTSINSKVKFSGKNIFNISNEVTRGVGSIEFANNGGVVMNRTSNQIANSEFWFSNIAPQTSVGYGNTITMGDGSYNEAYTYNNAPANYPAMYMYIKNIKVGDNVKWTQTGFQYFLNGNQGGNQNLDGQFKFGQNFQLKAPITTMPGAITLVGTQRAEFNAGTTFDINQRFNGAVIQVNGNSNVTFISPKQLHLAIQGVNGQPIATNAGIIAGPGSVTLNNSNIKTWISNDSAVNSPNGNNTSKFARMVVTNGQAVITDVDGVTAISNIVTPSTRELQTIAIPVGKINIQYVDQNGKNLGSPVELTLPPDPYIGEYISLITNETAIKNMPKGYMWALGKQVYAGAVKDAQSGGDLTTTDDNGDEFGQASVGIAPMEGGNYTYKVYVYGVKKNVTYRYVDVNHPERVLTSPMSGKSGTEAVGNLIPANYGNTIDWTNKYYTQDNVPEGYHYATKAQNQPTTTVVSDDNPVVNIYVEGNKQTVNPTYLDTNGNKITPNTKVVIEGITGETVKLPPAPDANNWAPDHVIVNGQKVAFDASFELANGTDSVTYVYHSLDIEKQAANKSIDDEATKVKGEIDNDPTLDDLTKKTQKDAVDKATNDAKSKIDQAIIPSEVSKAEKNGKAAIDASHQSGTPLSDQKKASTDAIDAEATKIKGEIDADVTLDNAEKATQKANVDADATAAKDKINAAPNSQSVKNIQAEGIAKIDTDHVSNKTSLPDQKRAAQNAIDAEATKIKGEIDADVTLDNAEKAKQKANVDADATTAKNKINDATNSQAVKDEQKAGISKIDSDHIPNKVTLVDQKTAAKAAIDQEATKIKAEIDADVTLDDATKAKQKSNVDTDAAAAKDKIDQAVDAQGVKDAQATGIAKIDSDHISGTTSLADQKKTAKDVIDQEATKVKAEIDADDNLDDATKAKQKSNVDIDAAAAKVKIDQATNAQGVKDARDAGIIKIDSDHVKSSISLDEVKQNDKNAIDQEATKVKAEIDADETLDNAEKASQKANVDTDAIAAKRKIDQATNAQGVKDATAAGITKIDSDHVSNKTSLADQKKAAQDAIDAEATKVKAQIDADTSLDSAEKAAQKGNVDADAASAKIKINQATGSQGVKDAKADGIAKIDADYVPNSTSLAGQKKIAKDAIDAEATKVKAEIDADVTLDDATKAKQKANVDTDADAAKAKIDQAAGSQGVKDAKADGIAKIDSDHIPGSTSLADQKKAAQAAIDQEATKIKGEIDADVTLDDDTKAKQKANVDTDAATAKTQIDQATNAQGVKNAKDQGITNI